MPINRKEQLIYTIMMVTFMAYTMGFYNISLEQGLSFDSALKAWVMFPVIFSLAFLLEWFIVGKISFKIIFKVLGKNAHPLKMRLFVPLVIVTGMASSMSLITTIIFFGFGANFFSTWLTAFGINFVFAYPLQVLIARPLIDFTFRSIFPIGTINMPAAQ